MFWYLSSSVYAEWLVELQKSEIEPRITRMARMGNQRQSIKNRRVSRSPLSEKSAQSAVEKHFPRRSLLLPALSAQIQMPHRRKQACCSSARSGHSQSPDSCGS